MQFCINDRIIFWGKVKVFLHTITSLHYDSDPQQERISTILQFTARGNLGSLPRPKPSTDPRAWKFSDIIELSNCVSEIFNPFKQGLVWSELKLQEQLVDMWSCLSHKSTYNTNWILRLSTWNRIFCSNKWGVGCQRPLRLRPSFHIRTF